MSHKLPFPEITTTETFSRTSYREVGFFFLNTIEIEIEIVENLYIQGLIFSL